MGAPNTKTTIPLLDRSRIRYTVWALCLAAAGAAAILLAAPAPAQTPKSTFFRIGTGATGGTYFPIGGLLANAISNPAGSRPCDRGGSCGVPGLIAVAQSTGGSVANVDAIAAGRLESGLSQSDVAYWAYHGTGIYRNKGKVAGLRAIANLYSESLHLVVRRGAGIRRVADLRGKRVSVGPKESGTRVDAGIVLQAFGLNAADLDLRLLKPGPASDRLRAGELDAFFFVAGTPAAAIAELAEHTDIALVPINQPDALRISIRFPFLSQGVIPAGVYKGVGRTPTLAVGAQWVVGARVDEAIVYGITKALWHENTRRLLDHGHAEGRSIRLESALDGIAIPLHPGAERFYREIGRLN